VGLDLDKLKTVLLPLMQSLTAQFFDIANVIKRVIVG
jgi:hypothetical protein